MRCKVCPKPSAAPLPVVPPYLNPRLVVSASTNTFRIVTLPFNSRGRVAPANPSRVAIGFIPFQGNIGSLRLLPEGVNTDYFLPIPNVVGIAWFYLFEHFVMVTNAWDALIPPGGTMGVYEITTLR